ncbi:unnamed protein product [Rotaria socialis]|uniref:Uncharacterized protein n=1 Tax=Rotaria socialis TaxID=392032 RepID=A0A818YUV4_9BILA|nr:unnamed protein product [Rotaria socialis]
MPRRKNRKTRIDPQQSTVNNNSELTDTTSNSIPSSSTNESQASLPSHTSAAPKQSCDLQVPLPPEALAVLTSASSARVQPPSEASAAPKSAWGARVQPPSEASTVPSSASNARVPPPLGVSAVPKSAWGARVPLTSEPPTSAWAARVQPPSEASPVPSSASNARVPPPLGVSAVPKSVWGDRVPPTSEPPIVPTSASIASEPSPPEASAVPKSAWGARVQPPSEASAVPKSAWSHSSRSFHPKERSSSALPTMNESMRNLSVNKTTTLSREPRSESVLPMKRRRLLCSAVPDTAVLCPIRRPDDGGSSGTAISVYTNHFRVDIDDATINQYDIDIVIVDSNGKSRPARKDDRWETMQRIAKEKKNFPLAWYDDGKTLYTRALLPDLTKPIEIKMKKGDEVKTFQLNIKNLVRQDKIQNIFDFIQKNITIRPRETIRIIETLFKQRARNDLVCVRNQFYNRNQILDDLQDGRGMAKGFYQALFLTRCGPTLNVNLTFTCFYMPLNFVDFARKYLRKDITANFTEYEAKIFKKLIRDLLIETEHTGRTIRYKFRGFGRPANQLMFARGRVDEESADAGIPEQISVADYFEQQYKRKLVYPHLPCIDATNGINKRANWLPMELVKLVEWQRSLKPLDATQRARVSSKSIIKPLERYNQIMNIMQGRDFETDVHLKDLNIRVHKNEMLQLKARIIAPPDIRYRHRQDKGEVIEHVDVGKWRISNRFYTTPEINNCGIIYFGHTPDQEVNGILNKFSSQLPELLKHKGIIIRTKLTPIIKTATKEDIENTLTDASQKHWQLAIVILNSNSDQVHDYVKQLGNQKLGLRTQCVDMQALRSNINKLHMYVDNLSQKINGKLGGINSVVNTKLALSHSSREDIFMFFGADVTHSTCSTDRPSIAAVVASRDPTNTLYAARICEQYPKKGRCSVEIIKELDRMVADLLQVFARTCGGRLPNKIVFYRDGVDEGQYQKVLDNEVNKIKNACRIVYGDRPLPKLTFIVVKKRHNTRFFLYDGKQTMNVQAGTVVDQDITHPFQFDFYLCSQAAIMGTSRPTLYHVLHDDIGFSSDDVQRLTYWLCHTDMRCTKSVSIPAPVHYAHLAAFGSRALNFDDDRTTDNVDDDDGDDEQLENYSIDDIQTKLMVLDPKVADDMWFI